MPLSKSGVGVEDICKNSLSVDSHFMQLRTVSDSDYRQSHDPDIMYSVGDKITHDDDKVETQLTDVSADMETLEISATKCERKQQQQF